MPKRVNHRLVKVHRSYSVEQTANTLGVHKNTVRGWIKAGLATIGGRGVTLVLGAELRGFLWARRKRARQRCPPGFLFCMKCRVPQPPAGGMAEYAALTATSGDIVACCPACVTVMYRRIRQSDVGAFLAATGAAITLAPPRIRD